MSLTFDELRQANVKRAIEDFNHPLDSWSLTDWCCAMAGEVGEACNFAKKIRRGLEVDTKQDLKIELGRELADVITYADLIAASLGIDLGEIIKQKFNEVSDRRGAPTKL